MARLTIVIPLHPDLGTYLPAEQIADAAVVAAKELQTKLASEMYEAHSAALKGKSGPDVYRKISPVHEYFHVTEPRISTYFPAPKDPDAEKWEYKTTDGPRKNWPSCDDPPEGEGWVRDESKGHGGHERGSRHPLYGTRLHSRGAHRLPPRHRTF